MGPYFRSSYGPLVDSPNGRSPWWHSLPLPDGSRVNGASPDKDRELKMWEAFGIPNEGGLAGKRVLDIGAADGYFTLAAHMAGASHVTAIGTEDWSTWPHNIRYSSETWGVRPEIVTADFRTHPFSSRFDVIFFLGVLYHLEDVFGCMQLLRNLLTDGGVIYMETQMSTIQSDLPIFEYASDIYPTVCQQERRSLGGVGISNFLFPNDAAVRNLAYSYDFECTSLTGPRNRYTQEFPSRCLYKLTKVDPGSA